MVFFIKIKIKKLTELEEEQNEIGGNKEDNKSSDFSKRTKRGLFSTLIRQINKKINLERYFQEVLEESEFRNLKILVDDSNRVISWEELGKEGVVKLDGRKVEGIYWKGCLDLKRKKIKTLWKVKKIEGSLDCENLKTLEDLGELEDVGKGLSLQGTLVKTLGKLKKVGLDLDCGNLKILEDLGELEEVGRWLDLRGTSIVSLGKLKKVGWDLYCNIISLKDIGKLEWIGGSMYVKGISSESKQRFFRKIREGKLKVERKIIPYGDLNQMYEGGKLNYKKFRKKYGDNINEIEDEEIKEIARELLIIEYELIKEDLKEKLEKIQKKNEGKKLTEEEKREIRERIIRLGKRLREIREKIESFGVKLGNL